MIRIQEQDIVRIMRFACLLAALVLLTQPLRALAAGPTAPEISAALNYKSLPPGQQAVVAVVIDVPPGFHIQSNEPIDPQFIPLEIAIKPNPALQTFAAIFPTPLIKNYPALGRLSVYEGRVIVYIPVQVKQSAALGPTSIEGTVRYQ